MDALCEYSYCSLATSMKEAGMGELLDSFPSLLEERLLSNGTNESLQELWRNFLSLERSEGMQGSASVILRIFISIVYSVVCALGLVGNVLVLYLMKSKWKKSSINLFVTCLALTDFQFVLTLPFWAVENALDYTWLFGNAMCKILSYVTAMNMYASVFFLTAMSIARYHAVASALKTRSQGGLSGTCSPAKWLCILIWILAILASLPTGIFSTTARIFGEEFCLIRIPDSGVNNTRLGLYQAQKVLLGFLLPLGIITLCYLLLVRFISDRHVGASSCGPSTKRRAKVTKSVTIVVLSFFLCWLPNQALTTWGILIKLNALHFSHAYFLSQAYLFPITVCLAHSNSCLNPIFYCLMRREFRKALKKLLWRITSPSITTMRPFTATTKPEQEEQVLHSLMPVNPTGRFAPAPHPPPAVAVTLPDIISYPPGVVVYTSRSDALPTSPSAEHHC
ncbi:relaxin-3 receptor 1 [Sceloporus undulatus]|uniref:relaxin-3 receptor 1 n=1 Tax=Sceloporus undulatus TaxID=8520 RepID=UPI001C4CA655|nr:relaxin-3 receptor 1 [Sceloporus undulatus]